tara:strand:- start:975 stop:1283 length:309 start_codon:yes stop_codon:yes gene_type:complete
MPLKVFKPVNRYLQIVPHFEEAKTDAGILLPEDHNANSPYVRASVVAVASDCNKEIKTNFHETFPNTMNIIVDKTMIQQVDTSGDKYNLILENYVLGIIKDV